MPMTADKVAERTGYIGGSDAAAVLGLSRWKTPLQVWAEKTGQVDPEDVSNRLPIEVGNELEDLVAKLWTKRTGKKLHRVNETLIHPNYSYIRCNIDRRVVGEDTIFEAKTASAWKAKEWEGEDIPQEYIIQCMHNLAVTGKEKCEIAVLIGGNVDFKFKTIHRDPSLIADIVHKEAEFWTRFIEPKVMPTVISSQDSDTLYKLFPAGDEGSDLELPSRFDEAIDNIKALERIIENAEAEMDQHKNEIKAVLKDSATGQTSRYKVYWKNQLSSRLDTARIKAEAPDLYKKYSKESASRVFRITDLKGKK